MERKRFTIPQVTEKEKPQKTDTINPISNGPQKPIIKTSEPFVSPIYGSKVKDKNYYPQSETGGTSQYDYLKPNNNGKDYVQQYIVPSQKEFYGYDPIHDHNEENQRIDSQRIDNQRNDYQRQDSQNDLNQYSAYENNANPYQELTEQRQMNEYQNRPQAPSTYYVEKENRPEFDEKTGQRMGEDGTSYIRGNLTSLNDNQGIDNQRNDNQRFDNQNGFEEYPLNNNQNDYDENEEDEDILDIAKEEVYQKPVAKENNENNKLKGYFDLEKQKKSKYVFPSLDILKKSNPNAVDNFEAIQRQESAINQTLFQFDIDGRVCKYHKGPTFTLFEVELGPKVKYQSIQPIGLNLQGRLEASSIRIQSPIPGKSTVGIEVPNDKKDMVYFGDLICNKEFLNDGNPLNIVLGRTVTGKPIYLDITNMPHGLIAGCTKSGKSVCINSIISSILYKAHPDDVKLILIDPKIVEFKKYEGIPHLATQVISDPKLAIATMRWLVDEMENRYALLASIGLTNYQEYLERQKGSMHLKHIPYLLLIIDEFADLMQTGGSEVEDIVKRLTAKARAAGIHLIVATQRPSVDVISGTIKANLPSRIAFKVQKAQDSNIILDRQGAEKLLGYGDMLYLTEAGDMERIQGCYISTEEIHDIVDSIKTGDVTYVLEQTDLKKKQEAVEEDAILEDPRFVTVARDIVLNQNASMNRIQKKFGLGFNTAQAMIEKLSELQVISENVGCKARTVLMEPADLEDILAKIL